MRRSTKLSPEAKAGYDEGYTAALDIVRKMAKERETGGDLMGAWALRELLLRLDAEETCPF